jgi:hypothetical protein
MQHAQKGDQGRMKILYLQIAETQSSAAERLVTATGADLEPGSQAGVHAGPKGMSLGAKKQAGSRRDQAGNRMALNVIICCSTVMCNCGHISHH